MTGKKIKRIPYGVANYELLVHSNFYYVDKTSFLPVVEDAGNYLFFIRPRRFGKTLFHNLIQDAAVDFIQRYDDYLTAHPKKDYFSGKIEKRNFRYRGARHPDFYYRRNPHHYG